MQNTERKQIKKYKYNISQRIAWKYQQNVFILYGVAHAIRLNTAKLMLFLKCKVDPM